jgi:hypothetical protein
MNAVRNEPIGLQQMPSANPDRMLRAVVLRFEISPVHAMKSTSEAEKTQQNLTLHSCMPSYRFAIPWCGVTRKYGERSPDERSEIRG